VETIMRRAAATGLNRTKVIDAVTLFSGASRIEGVHPLQFGFVRRKVRTQRRYGMPVVNPLIFYPWRVYDFSKTAFRWIKLVRRYRGIMKKVMADPAVKSYTDHAMEPPPGHNAPMSDFVKTYADKIPHTHGAPVQEAAAG
jgi:hypothetical protein